MHLISFHSSVLNSSLSHSAGVVASVISLYWNSVVKKNHSNHASHGASGEYRTKHLFPGGSSWPCRLGAIYSIVSLFACVAPRAQILLFAIIPLPAWAFVTGIVLWDGYSTITDKVGVFSAST